MPLEFLIPVVVGLLAFLVGSRNADTTEFSSLIEAYNKLSDDMRIELEMARGEIRMLRREVSECHRVISELSAKLAKYE